MNTVGVLACFPQQPSNLQYVYQIEVLTEHGASVKPGTACDVTSAFARHKRTYGHALESLTIMSEPMQALRPLNAKRSFGARLTSPESTRSMRG